MFGLKIKKTSKSYNSDLVDKESIGLTLKDIIKILREFSHSGQADYMDRLFETLTIDDNSKFKLMSQTVDIWGGSGAVWEVWIPDNNKEKEFQKLMISFAKLLLKNGIKNHGITSIKSLFEKEVKKN